MWCRLPCRTVRVTVTEDDDVDDTVAKLEAVAFRLELVDDAASAAAELESAVLDKLAEASKYVVRSGGRL